MSGDSVNVQSRPNDGASDVAKYFENVTEGGKQYSKCLLKNCGRRLPGTSLAHLQTHMSVAHNMNFHPTQVVVDRAELNEQPSDNIFNSTGDMLIVNDLDQGWSESSDIRKYFQIINEDGQPQSRCLIRNCMRRIAGNHLSNLRKHFKAVHDVNLNQWSSDGDDEIDCDGQASSSEGDSAKVRQHFRTIIEDDKLYSKCLLRGCKRRLAGNDLFNLQRHLNHGHNVKVIIKSEMAPPKEPQKFFERIEIDGKVLSKCLIKDCDRRLGGYYRQNLERHLDVMHDIKSFPATTESAVGVVSPTDEPYVHLMNNEISGGDVSEAPSNADDKLSALLSAETFDESVVENTTLLCKDARKFFQCITENGKSFARCLIRNCSRTIDGITKEKLTRHLCIAHKMSSEVTDVRAFFESDETDGKLFSVCLVQNCTRRIVGRHLNNLKKHLRGAHDMIVTPSPREMKSELEDPRKYFKIVIENGKAYSKCLIDDCDCRIAGTHVYNLKRHLNKHKIDLNSTVFDSQRNDSSETDGRNENEASGKVSKGKMSATVTPKTCRLCFEEKPNTINIFCDKYNVASVIRVHFPVGEISPEDSLPKHVCSACWTSLSNFHRFYVSANEAKATFLAKIGEATLLEAGERTLKHEPVDVDKQVEERADIKNFSTVFCEVFLPECEEFDDETSPKMEHCKTHTESRAATRRILPTRKKTEKISMDRKSLRQRSSKRSAKDLDKDFECEFCKESFSTFDSVQQHYANEHRYNNDLQSDHRKRTRRAR